MKNSSLTVALRRLIVVGVHVALWTGAYVGSFLLRYDGTIPRILRVSAFQGLLLCLALRVVTFWFAGLFHGMLRYSGIPEARAIVRTSSLASVLFLGAGVVVQPLLQPRSIYVGEWLLSIVAAAGLRVAVRIHRERRRASADGANATRAVLIGAGDAGELLLRDLARFPTAEMNVVGILDDDPDKHASTVRGIRVLGPATDVNLRRAVEDLNVGLAVLAIPSASGQRTREIVSLCRSLGIETKTLPSLQQILTGDVRVSMLRNVAIEDLLRREPIQLDESSMAALLRGKRVLVTGGAGSIGSELARQAARYQPALLALVDHNENGLFYLERELSAAFPGMSQMPCVADVKDVRRMSEILRNVRPHVVLHAAAHKHVPMMEANCVEALKNNVFGTRIVADLANAFGVETFVLISTDKAVNPTSIMGASKRIAELYIQSLSSRARTRFVVVRFGNVLGSAGSVVPVFREQIASGGPVTVTHAEMTRYFMTIPEASQLVLQAGALARGGEIFVLDMGDPIKIVDLARDMIRMSGLKPETDIPIVFTGLRPGEKLFEEIMHSSEAHDRTVHPKILVGRTSPLSEERIAEMMAVLSNAVDGTPADVYSAIASSVPEAKLDSAKRQPSPDLSKVLAALEPLDTVGVAIGSPSVRGA